MQVHQNDIFLQIGHHARPRRASATAPLRGHVQNRIRRRQVRWGQIEHSSEAEQPRTDGGPGRQAKVCQHRRGGGLACAHRRRHTKEERCDKIETLQLHVPRGHAAQGSCRVEQERDNTSRGSNNGDTTGRKRRRKNHLRVVRPRALRISRTDRQGPAPPMKADSTTHSQGQSQPNPELPPTNTTNTPGKPRL